MEFLTGKIKPIYFRYLAAAIGSSLISSIYSIVDMAMVGQYHGPEGTAALAVVAPIWNIIYSLGLLVGIGGSVIFSTLKGKAGQEDTDPNEYFTASAVAAVVIIAAVWLTVALFDKQLLLLFGAEESLLPLARRYVLPVKFAIPCFCSTRCWRPTCATTAHPGWRRPESSQAASSTSSATGSSSFSWTWASWARDWPRRPARYSRW